jgi:hypothetical protein
MSKEIKIIVEEHADGFVAYPLGVDGSVAGKGETAEAAIADARTALKALIAEFGPSVVYDDDVLDAFVREGESEVA